MRARFTAAGQFHEGVYNPATKVLKTPDGSVFNEDEVAWHPPVTPRSIVGLALNYADHADELGLERPEEPTIFLKPVSSLIGHRANVVFPTGTEFMHYEAELAVVIGTPCRKATTANALSFVAGYTIANDITVRDHIRNVFRPPVRAKGFDTFGPLGPGLIAKETVADPGRLELRAYVNGELKQRGNTSLLVHDVPSLIVFISSFMTLMPGDVILTGTPKGIAKIWPGDVVRIEIDGFGALENTIVAEKDAK